jgi:hypothetical protein
MQNQREASISDYTNVFSLNHLLIKKKKGYKHVSLSWFTIVFIVHISTLTKNCVLMLLPLQQHSFIKITHYALQTQWTQMWNMKRICTNPSYSIK